MSSNNQNFRRKKTETSIREVREYKILYYSTEET